jgi:transposase
MRGAVHMQVSMIGLDLAKRVFQVHGVDSAGRTIIRKRLRRCQVIDFFAKLPPCWLTRAYPPCGGGLPVATLRRSSQVAWREG